MTGSQAGNAHAPGVRIIAANEYRRERWRNGQGWTREVCRSPGGGDWDWRLSIAEIECAGRFSTFPGVQRELLLLAGNGLDLRFDDGEVAQLRPPHDRHRFVGDRDVHGALVDGPVHAFNLMSRSQRVDAQLWHRPLVGPMVIFAEPRSTWVVHMVAGQAQFADGVELPPLATGDTAVIAAGPDKLRHVLDGGGEALLLRFSPTRWRERQ